MGAVPCLLQLWSLLRARGQGVYSLNNQSGCQTTSRLWAELHGGTHIYSGDPG